MTKPKPKPKYIDNSNRNVIIIHPADKKKPRKRRVIRKKTQQQTLLSQVAQRLQASQIIPNTTAQGMFRNMQEIVEAEMLKNAPSLMGRRTLPEGEPTKVERNNVNPDVIPTVKSEPEIKQERKTDTEVKREQLFSPDQIIKDYKRKTKLNTDIRRGKIDEFYTADENPEAPIKTEYGFLRETEASKRRSISTPVERRDLNSPSPFVNRRLYNRSGTIGITDNRKERKENK